MLGFRDRIRGRRTLARKRNTAATLLSLLVCTGSVGASGAIETFDMSSAERGAVDLDGSERLRVVATTSIVGDIVANVGGDDIVLEVLIVGQDPHTYRPTPSAMTAIERAHIVFTNGHGLEEGLLGTIDEVAGGVVFALAEHARGEIEAPGTRSDPHAWLNPRNVAGWVEDIEFVLSRDDPGRRTRFKSRAASYLQILSDLDYEIHEALAGIPSDSRKLVTDHDSFGHFASAYGLTIVGSILPVSTSAQISPRALAELIDLLRREKATTLFVGTTAGRDVEMLARTLEDEIGVRVRIVQLHTGSLAPPGTPGDTYVGYMQHNTTRLVEGLSH